MSTDISSIIEDHIQIDPSFKTERCYVRISAPFIFKELLLKQGYEIKQFCLRTINNVLNRMGHSLKKVLKTKPLKKIPETDAIFENVAAKHAQAKANPRILRISIDVKAKVKIGNLSRGGYSRMLQAPQADDHDQHWDAVLVPFGIQEISTDDTFIIFGTSKETSDFIVDALQLWWQSRAFNPADYELLMIDVDNGKSVASNTRLFQKRIVEFAQQIQLPIQLVYYPPYHSKYNRIERFWAAVENYWRPIILDTIDKAIKVAQQVTFNGINPIVQLLDKSYQAGVKVSSDELKELQKFITRNPDLKRWDVLVNPLQSG